VRACVAVEWIAARFGPRGVVLWRSPLNLVASHLDRGWTGTGLRKRAVAKNRFSSTSVWPPTDGSRAESLAWDVCARLTLLLEAAERHPDWLVVRHESLCADPARGYRSVVESLGLPWSETIDGFLARS